MVKVLTTNGSHHSATVWADVTADLLFNPDDAAADKRRAVKEFQLKVAALLDGHHTDVETAEKAKIAADPAHINSDYLYHGDRAEKVVDEIIALSKGSALEAHCARPEWRPVAIQVVGTQFASNAFVHRSYHADANIDQGCEHSKKFRAAQLAQIGAQAAA